MIAGWFFLGFCAGWYANKLLDAHEAACWAKERIDRAEALAKATELECDLRIKAVHDSYRLPWSGDSYEA